MAKEVTITKYETADGRQFDTLQQARRHEIRRAMEAIICGRDGTLRWEEGLEDEITDRLIVNASEVIQLLQSTL